MCNAPMEGVKQMWRRESNSPKSAIESENSVRAFPKSYCNAATTILTCRNTFIHRKERLLFVGRYCAT